MTRKVSVPKERRVPTYVRRKEESEVLQRQLRELQQQLDHLQEKVNGEAVQRQMYASIGLNVELKKAMTEQQFGVAITQSMLDQWLQNQSTNPMGMRIQLGREWTQRRETLLKMKDERLSQGFHYVIARSHHLDALKPHLSEQRFEDTNGDFCSIRNEVIPFPGVSMRTLFEALQFTINTFEISISEQLGHITVRDDYDAVDLISNYRLISGTNSGVTTELKAVTISQYFEHSNEFGGQPYVVIAFDSVDQDDLHPFNPQKHVRKMICGTVVLVPVKCKKSGNSSEKEAWTTNQERSDTDAADEEDEITVSMLRSLFVKTCRPQFDVSEDILEELQEHVTRWGDVVIQSVRRLIYAQ